MLSFLNSFELNDLRFLFQIVGCLACAVYLARLMSIQSINSKPLAFSERLFIVSVLVFGTLSTLLLLHIPPPTVFLGWTVIVVLSSVASIFYHFGNLLEIEQAKSRSIAEEIFAEVNKNADDTR